MQTVSQASDSRTMPFAEPSTAPSALSVWLWRWLAERVATRTPHPHDVADALDGHAQELPATDPRLASVQRAVADLDELRHGR